jgi:Dolichyl-phosphate-mannose-protein mannosyltransferase
VVAKANGTGIGRVNIYHIVGLAFLLRALLPTLAYLHTQDVTIFSAPDTESYVAPAQELIAHHRFFAHGAPEIFRTPGYSLLLIPGLVLGHLVLATILIQILISCFTVYMVYRTARLLFSSERIAMTAAVLYAIEPLSVLYTGMILTETLFAALVMLWFYFLLKYLNRPMLRDLGWSGIFLTASVYVRPVAYLLIAITALGLFVWVFLSAKENKRSLVEHIAIFLVVSLGLTGLWQIRNGEETGYFGFSTVGPVNMYFYEAASVLAVQHRVPFYQMQAQLGYLDERTYFARHPEQTTWPPAQRFRYMNSEAEHILLRNPLTYARIHLQGIARIILDPDAIEFLKFFDLYPKQGGLLGKAVDIGILRTIGLLFAKQPLVFWSSALLMPLQLLLFLSAGVVLFSRRLMREPQIIVAILGAAYYLTISGGSVAVSRYRHPAMPIICVLAGYGLCVIWCRLRSPQQVCKRDQAARRFGLVSCTGTPSSNSCPS